MDHALEASLEWTWVATNTVDLDAVHPAKMEMLVNPCWVESQASSLQIVVNAARHAGLADQLMVPAAAWQ